MARKLRQVRMSKDDLIWEKLEEASEEGAHAAKMEDVYRAVAKTILQYKPGEGEVVQHRAIQGGYNMVYRLQYKDGSSVIMRVTIPGSTPFADEKVRYEVATMRYVAAHTDIPVPYVYGYGTGAENPTGLGAFIVMDYIEHKHSMSRELLDPNRPIQERPVLDRISAKKKLELLYGQMASIMLKLYDLPFPRIGSLVEVKKDITGQSLPPISIQGRPLTVNMNDIAIHTSAPPSVALPPLDKTYETAHDWYCAVADMHLAQLAFQHNDAIDDEDDAREKYIVRQLFRNMAHDGRFEEPFEAKAPFRLFCEDFRPANVLLDDNLRVVAVIDWEFTFVAPASFSCDPPWWLLLEEPDWWEGAYRTWIKLAEPPFQTFLRLLRKEEAKRQRPGDPHEMSRRMQASWDNRSWLLRYALRKSWCLDTLWWRFLDATFWPEEENADQDYHARLGKLHPSQRAIMEEFVARKMEESKETKLVQWDVDEAVALFRQLRV